MPTSNSRKIEAEGFFHRQIFIDETADDYGQRLRSCITSHASNHRHEECQCNNRFKCCFEFGDDAT